MQSDLVLFSPAKPGGRGDDNRWILQIRLSSAVFQRVALYGPRADQENEAMLKAAETLGYSPAWVKVVPKSDYAKPAWRAEAKPKRATKARKTNASRK